MSTPRHTTRISDLSPKERREYIRSVLDDAGEKLKARTAAGLCSDCDDPIAGTDSGLFYGDTRCAEHARAAELENLIEDQEDDRNR